MVSRMNGLRKWLSRHPGLHIFAGKVRHWLTRCWMRLCWIRPVDRRKVVFVSYHGRGFGDNGKAIALSLLEKCPGLNLVWAAVPGARDSIPAPIRFVPFRSLAYYREMATAAVWLDNSRKSDDVVKRKGQYYIQTWHGDLGLKKAEKDAESALAPTYLADAQYDSRMADLFLSGSDFFTARIHDAFWYDGEILKCGIPRMDVAFHPVEGIRDMVREKLGIPADKRIVLYAPTFRDHGEMDCYQLDFARALEALRASTGEDWVFAVRLHPNIVEKADFIPYSDTVFNATTYPDLYELLPAVDMVVTDYSSLMFEAGFLGKPVILFATDIAEYVGTRGEFYFDIRSLPFPLAENNQELLNRLSDFDKIAYAQAIHQFYEEVGLYEGGRASEQVADRILEILGR